ncbi:hypothetical protein BJ944DRAFT_238716 [Cunninghamella echinulata]|nr:hypothetical protein BJ944DRAFT_238716 [Cunninghamella echinulata]
MSIKYNYGFELFKYQTRWSTIGQADLYDQGKNVIALICSQGSDFCINGCEASHNCPGIDFCSGGKCVSEEPGINCGDCGKLPINRKCCGRGVPGDNGVCCCVTGSKSCKEVGYEYTVNLNCCNDGRCCRPGTYSGDSGICSS